MMGNIEMNRTRTLKIVDAWGDVGGNNDANTWIIDHSNGNIEIGNGRTLEIVDACRDVCRDAMHCVSTAERVPPPLTTTYVTKNKFAPQSKKLASIIRGFKSSVTTKVKNWKEDKF